MVHACILMQELKVGNRNLLIAENVVPFYESFRKPKTCQVRIHTVNAQTLNFPSKRLWEMDFQQAKKKKKKK